MTPEQGDECHAGGWDDSEIDAFTAREARFARMGRVADAEHLAERLALRDREDDDRHLCLEYVHYWCGRCGNARAADVGRDLPEVMVTQLQRCAGFAVVVS